VLPDRYGNKMNPAQVTDYHCHLLHGIDDGPATLEESIAMAQELAEAGFASVCCTPHRIRGVYETTPDRVRRETRQLQQTLVMAGIPLKLIPGTEYYLDEYLLDLLDDPLLLPGNHLLVEIWPGCDPQLISETLGQVVSRGITPLIAHPERCELLSVPERRTSSWGTILGSVFKVFGREWDQISESDKVVPAEGSLLDSLLSLGCSFQGNLGSFSGHYGPQVQRRAELFREMGLYTHCGSDLHKAGSYLSISGISAVHDTMPRFQSVR